MKKLSPKELKAGMIALEAIVTPLGQPIAPAGETLTRQIINKMKLYNCEYAVVDVEEEPNEVVTETTSTAPLDAIPEITAEPAPEPYAPKEVKTRVEEAKTHSQKIVESNEFHDFEMDYSHALSFLKEVFEGVQNKTYTIEEDQLLKSIQPLFISRNTITELFDMIQQMHSLNDSVYAHCVNVALISRMIGRWLHMEPHDLDTLTCCGLLHDIGKLVIPEEILNKPGKLTDEEFAIVKSHPKYGYELLRNQNIDSRIKKSALMHHERYDGSGYPNGLSEELLSDFAMIVAIADVYDAMTAARAYRVPLSPFQVIANFEKDGFQKYHTKYIYVFLHRIAATYQNNRVMLSDGRACKIVMLNQNSLSRPIVRFDDGEVLDLSTQTDLQITRIL
ncbi:MAG: HD-GYP domain-containing protein [Lachnospiraceae bacterium]|nr:HD-GYP domain-containing protein [Lachnospiraceae bacterium]